MKVTEKKISALTPYENNPRKNDAAVPAVKASIREFGFDTPLVIDKDGVIVTGHTRLKAAKALGMKTVPTVTADDLTEEQIRAFRLADNKTAEGELDSQILADELATLDGIDMEAFGFIPEFSAAEPAEEVQAAFIWKAVMTSSQREIIDRAFQLLPEIPKEVCGNVNKNGNKLYTLAKIWMERQGNARP